MVTTANAASRGPKPTGARHQHRHPHDLPVAAVIISFVVLELGVGMSQTVSNDTIVASVPSAKAGAASVVSETAYELGAVVGTATLGTIFSAFYRANVTVPGDLSPTQAKDGAESIAGAISVARTLPDQAGAQLLESARLAFDSGIAPTATIAATLTLVAAVIVAVAFRGNKMSTGQQQRSPISKQH
jgi:DHA2 family multidrug resistance protein-like MFS transporter